MQALLSHFQSTTSNRAGGPAWEGSSPGFPASLPGAGLSHPGEEHFHQPPCLSLFWPLLSLSEAVSIARNPGSSTTDTSLLPLQKSHKGQGSPLYKENKQVSGSQGVGVGWEGALLGGRGVGSQLAQPGPTLPLPGSRSICLSRHSAAPGLDWTVAGDRCLPLSSRECSWLEPRIARLGHSPSAPALPGAWVTSWANLALVLRLPCSVSFCSPLQP